MPSARLQLNKAGVAPEEACPALPNILKTQNGTVLLEIQGVINVGDRPLIRTELDIDREASHVEQSVESIALGSVDLSHVDEAGQPVQMLLGQNQLLHGHVQKLSLPLAVLQMPASGSAGTIPVVEIVTHKVVFNKRPEPVTG